MILSVLNCVFHNTLSQRDGNCQFSSREDAYRHKKLHITHMKMHTDTQCCL